LYGKVRVLGAACVRAISRARWEIALDTPQYPVKNAHTCLFGFGCLYPKSDKSQVSKQNPMGGEFAWLK